MAKAAGFAMRLCQTGIYFLALCCCALTLGIYSFFLASLSHNNEYIAPRYKAIEGMSGAGCLYTIFACIFTLFLGGVSFFALLAIILDLCFVGCFVAIAYYTRGGDGSCRGFVNTPLGSGISGQDQVNGHNIHTICRLQTAVFAVSIVAIFLFFVAACFQMALARHHQREKRYGPSPANNYTTGSGRTGFWRRGNRSTRSTRDAEMATAGAAGAALGVGAARHHDRHSHETGFTSSTLGNHAGVAEAKYGTNY